MYDTYEDDTSVNTLSFNVRLQLENPLAAENEKLLGVCGESYTFCDGYRLSFGSGSNGGWYFVPANGQSTTDCVKTNDVIFVEYTFLGKTTYLEGCGQTKIKCANYGYAVNVNPRKNVENIQTQKWIVNYKYGTTNTCIKIGDTITLHSQITRFYWVQGLFFCSHTTTCGANQDLTNFGISGYAGRHPFKFKVGLSSEKLERCVDLLNPTGGSRWELVRRVKPGLTWHPATDNLKGTDSYCYPTNSEYCYAKDALTADVTWTLPFNTETYDEFLFTTGNCHTWLITTVNAAIGEKHTFGLREILQSSKSTTPYTAKWLNREHVTEDPWISVNNHDIHPALIVYGEDSYAGHSHPMIAEGGANVFIRQSNR
jgi:hypothetical protein